MSSNYNARSDTAIPWFNINLDKNVKRTHMSPVVALSDKHLNVATGQTYGQTEIG